MFPYILIHGVQVKTMLDPSRALLPSSASFRRLSIGLVVQLKSVGLGWKCRLLLKKADGFFESDSFALCEQD